ncbi:MAG: deoxyribose-phosphate aldolase [Lachnospiraceae bacterium]
MIEEELLSHVDHTLLNATATWSQIQKLCEEMIEYGTASVCVPPCYVRRIHDCYGAKVTIGTVVGFPLGYSTTETKKLETRQAVLDGAAEIDMVINLTDVKNGSFDQVRKEIETIRQEVKTGCLKVIVETCYLTEEEKKTLCNIVRDAGADYIKTSTGFGTSGADLKDIQLFRETIGDSIKIKAAGGIKKLEDMEHFIEAGCERIGSSSAIMLLKEKE